MVPRESKCNRICHNTLPLCSNWHFMWWLSIGCVQSRAQRDAPIRGHRSLHGLEQLFHIGTDSGSLHWIHAVTCAAGCSNQRAPIYALCEERIRAIIPYRDGRRSPLRHVTTMTSCYHDVIVGQLFLIGTDGGSACWTVVPRVKFYFLLV